MKTLQVDKDIELQIRGSIFAGDYQGAADIAVCNGSDAVLLAMNRTFQDGYEQALSDVVKTAADNMQRNKRR